MHYSKTIKAIVGDSGSIYVEDRPFPELKTNEVLVKVTAAALNRADLLQAKGLYPAPDNSKVLGLELSGVRVDTGEEVLALVPSGAFAQYIAVDKKCIVPLPKNIDPIIAAALPEALATCQLNILNIGKLKRGDDVIIHGGTSGIGSFAIQICKAFGARVFTTVGNDDKKQFCLKLGADFAINYKTEDFATIVKASGGCDLVLDILGGKYLPQNIAALKFAGRLVMIALMNESEANISLSSILMKNLQITGSTLRSKSLTFKRSLLRQVVKNLYPLIEKGKVKPVIDSIFSFDKCVDAFLRLETREHKGKVIIKFDA
jgi:putative PIG3 family NAD(P)H quinone oxidoreductase